MKETIISQIEAAIYGNDNQEITGQRLQNVLVSIVSGVFDSIPEVVQQEGNSQTAVMSQNAVTNGVSGIVERILGTTVGYTYMGTATTSTVPPTITAQDKIFYIAIEEGVYAFNLLNPVPGLSIIKSVNGSWQMDYLGLPAAMSRVQTLGDNDKAVMSQKAVTDLYNQGYKLAGTATPSTTPTEITAEDKVFYIAVEAGNYTGFGVTSITELTIFKSDNGRWIKEGLKVPLILQTSFVGTGDTLVRSEYIEGFKGGRTYRIDIGNYDTTGVTQTNVAYDLFNVVAYDSEDNSNVIIKVACSESNDSVYDYYVFTVPENCIKIRVSGRATSGVAQSFIFTDVTDELESYKKEIALKLSVGEPVTLNHRMFPIYSTSLQYATGNRIGRTLESLETYKTSNINNVIFDLPQNTYLIKIQNHYKTTVSYGSAIFKNDVLTVPIINISAQDNEYMAVPSIDNGQMLLSYLKTTVITLYPYERVQYLENNMYNKEQIITDFDSFVSLTSSAGFKQADAIGRNVLTYPSVSYILNSSYHKLCLVPIKGFNSLKAVHFRTSADFGSAFIDKDMNIISVAFTKISRYDKDYNLECDIPENAEYFVYVAWNTIQPKILLENRKQIQDNVDKGIINGDITSSGIVASSTSVVLAPINMDKPFYLKVNEGYEIKSVNLFRGGDAVGYQYDINSIRPFQYFNNRVYSNNKIIPQFNARVVVNRSDGKEISPNEDIIKTLAYVDFASLKPVIPSNFEDFLIFKERLHQLTNIVWKAEKDIYPSNPSAYSESNFKEGRIYVGSPYSEAAEFSKYIGQNVSMRTFLSAIKNPRSVMYTERISADGNTSKYGIEYAGLDSYYCNPYYGTVCTGLTGYVADFVNLYISGGYHSGQVPGLRKIENCTSADIQPMDFIWNQGHCSIVEDVYEDEYGRRQFIVWAEQTHPVALASLYTPAEFDARMEEKAAEVWRYDNWSDITAPMNQPCVQTNMFDYPEPVLIDPYIRIFCGDYPCLCNGDPLFFNVLRDGRFSTVQVYHEEADPENTSPLDTVDISLLTHDDIYEDEEDWVKVDYTSNGLTAGKYKARVTDGTEYSGFVHFEIVQIDLFATKTENNTTISYNVQGGTPYLIRKERKDGMYQNIITELTASPITTNWTDYSTYPYIKIYVQGDYGTAVKRVLMQ